MLRVHSFSQTEELGRCWVGIDKEDFSELVGERLAGSESMFSSDLAVVHRLDVPVKSVRDDGLPEGSRRRSLPPRRRGIRGRFGWSWSLLCGTAICVMPLFDSFLSVGYSLSVRWLVYGGFVLLVLMPAVLAGWNANRAYMEFFESAELQGYERPEVVLLFVFEWSFLTAIYVLLVGLVGGVRLLVYSFRAFDWQFMLAFAIWLGLVAGVLWWGGFLDDFGEFWDD